MLACSSKLAEDSEDGSVSLIRARSLGLRRGRAGTEDGEAIGSGGVGGEDMMDFVC